LVAYLYGNNAADGQGIATPRPRQAKNRPEPDAGPSAKLASARI